MAHYDCSCCGEAMGISHERCSNCQGGGCHKPAPVPVSEERGFMVTTGRALVETCINDLRTLCAPVVIDGGAGAGESRARTRREAVIILHASGLVSVYEGWDVKADDIPELLAAKVLRGG